MNDRLKALRKLEADWDSYGARPITEAALATASALLDLTAVPLNDGGIQLEGFVDPDRKEYVEIVINSRGLVRGFFLDKEDSDDVLHEWEPEE